MSMLEFHLDKLEALIHQALRAGNDFEYAASYAAADTVLRRVTGQILAHPGDQFIHERLGTLGDSFARLTGFAPEATTRFGEAGRALGVLGTLRLNLQVQLQSTAQR